MKAPLPLLLQMVVDTWKVSETYHRASQNKTEKKQRTKPGTPKKNDAWWIYAAPCSAPDSPLLVVGFARFISTLIISLFPQLYSLPYLKCD